MRCALAIATLLTLTSVGFSRAADGDPAPAAPDAAVEFSVPDPAVSLDGACGTPLCDARECGQGCGLIGSIEWLNWRASRRGMDYASVVDPVWLTPVTLESLDFDRDNGLRAALGYQFDSGWEVVWNYTEFSTDASGRADQADNPNFELVSTRSFFDVTAEAVTATASLDYGVHDLEAGRWLLACDSQLAVRLFGGFRWATIDQQFVSRYSYLDVTAEPVAGLIGNRSAMDGYGLRVGAETHWTTCAGLSLFGRGAVSVLAGEFETQQLEADEVDGVILAFADDYTQAVPVVEAAAGAAWRTGNWEVKGGYELNTWFNMAEIGRSSYDLLLDGLFLGVGYSR
jgi:hypothetical protein